MAIKLSTEQKKAADATLARLDKVAQDVQDNHEKWGMSFEAAKAIVNHLDKVADSFEAAVYGEESLQRRQAEILKSAAVLQSDSDESYMQTFNAPSKPLQTDADEAYMSAYADDQSAAVRGGKSTSGKPLAP